MTRTRSQIGRTSRRRGNAAQREAGRYFCGAWGLPQDACTWTQEQLEQRDLIFEYGPGYGLHFEVKDWTVWQIKQWIHQVESDARGKDWIIVIRRPGAEWRAFKEPWYCLLPTEVLERRGRLAHPQQFDAATTMQSMLGAPGYVHWPLDLDEALATSGYLVESHHGKNWHPREWIKKIELGQASRRRAHIEDKEHWCIRIPAPETKIHTCEECGAVLRNPWATAYKASGYELMPGRSMADLLERATEGETR